MRYSTGWKPYNYKVQKRNWILKAWDGFKRVNWDSLLPLFLTVGLLLIAVTFIQFWEGN